MHVWYSRVQQPENPDYVLFDLDPPPQVGFAAAVEVAHLVREVLEAVGLEGYPKTSGSDGIHVCVPIDPVYSYDDTRRFSQVVGGLLGTGAPRAGHGAVGQGPAQGRVHRLAAEQPAARSSPPESARRPHRARSRSAAVLGRASGGARPAGSFHPRAVLERIALHGDLFAPVLAGGQRLERALAPGRSS